MNINKKILLAGVLTAFLSAGMASAQTLNFQKRYELLTAQVGRSGVGVETLLEKWEKADSTDRDMLLAKFDYYYTKSQSEIVVVKPDKKYLGQDPLLSLKDSTGNKVYYFREVNYDDAVFSQALNTAERLISLYPDELDYRLLKANALISYEKDSPDMAHAYLSELISVNSSRTKPWNIEGKKMDEGFFPDAMQEYCRTFYSVGSGSSMKVFFALSERLSKLYPENMCFLNNIATYYMVAEDKPKLALKYYNKVLKKVKDDEVALRNSYVAARKCGNEKLMEKYRGLLVKYGYVK